MDIAQSLVSRFVVCSLFVAGALGVAGCGSDDELSAATAEVDEVVEESIDSDEDHDENEEDHGDDEHGDDEDHGDDDHDEDKNDGDDEHDDDDHDDSSAGLGAHEHGVAELTVAWSGSDVAIDLISPSFNIVGFENEPTTDEELATVDDRTEALTSPEMLVFNEEAGCDLVGVATETEFEGSHAEITASWSYLCDNSDDINRLEASALFAEFPNLEDIDAQWASDANQSSAELTPSQTSLIFE